MITLAAVAISGSSMGSLLVQLVIAGLIFYVLWWALGKIAPPEPIGKILQVLLVLAIAVYLINILAGLGGHAFIAW